MTIRMMATMMLQEAGGDECVVLFVHIQVLDNALAKEVLEVFEAQRQVLNVLLRQLGPTFLANDQRSDETTSVRSNVHAVQLAIVVD